MKKKKYSFSLYRRRSYKDHLGFMSQTVCQNIQGEWCSLTEKEAISLCAANNAGPMKVLTRVILQGETSHRFQWVSNHLNNGRDSRINNLDFANSYMKCCLSKYKQHTSSLRSKSGTKPKHHCSWLWGRFQYGHYS
jgi:hypothetical protein